MVMRFLNSLNRFCQSLRRGPQRRPGKSVRRLTLEALEGRLVPSSATQVGSILTISSSPNDTIVLQEDPVAHGTLDVSDKAGTLGKFVISSISNVNVSVAGGDAVVMDDSAGIPFAPKTVVALSGTGANNALSLVGSQSLSGTETYTAGAAGAAGSVGVGNALFTFTGAIASVIDDLSAPQLDVRAPGQAVSLGSNSSLGSNVVTDTLNGLAGPGGGGNTLTFRGKTDTVLELLGNGASVNLNTTVAASGQNEFDVFVYGNQDQVNINATPRPVTTHAVVLGGKFAFVVLSGNAGPVSVNGNVTTDVELGSTQLENTSVTSGINGNVSVIGVDQLSLSDGGNTTTQEHMTVTESTVSGTGMFGNNSVVVSYAAIRDLAILTGRLDETYTVIGSHPGATFTSQVNIADNFGNAGFNVQVNVDSQSGLFLGVDYNNPANGSLDISAPSGANFSPPSASIPNGQEQIAFAGGLTSTVIYNGFDSVILA